MNRFVPLLAALVASFSFASSAHAQSSTLQLTSADQVIDHYEQAIGGHAAWDKLQTMTAKGNLELHGQLSIGGFEALQAAPSRIVVKLKNAGKVILATGCGNDVCWAYEPRGGLQRLSGDALAAALIDADFFSDLHLRKRYTNLKFVGTESQGASTSYVLEATPDSNTVVRLYFDAATGFKTREEKTTQDATGQHNATTIIEDYHLANGVAIPYTVRTSDPELTIHITQVEWNAPIDDSKFAIPSPESLQPPPKLVVAPQTTTAGSSAAASPAQNLRPDSGGVSGNTYHNDYFSFTYQFPADWSVASQATTQHLMDIGRTMVTKGNEEKKLVLEAASQHTYPLLTISRYPYGTPGKLNQIIQLVAEDISYAPGLQESKDYLTLMTHAVLSASANYEIMRDARPMNFGGRTFYAAQLMKPGPVPIYQWYVCNVENGMALTWIFTAPGAAAADAELQSLNSLAFGR